MSEKIPETYERKQYYCDISNISSTLTQILMELSNINSSIKKSYQLRCSHSYVLENTTSSQLCNYKHYKCKMCNNTLIEKLMKYDD
jgi:transposase-like protein